MSRTVVAVLAIVASCSVAGSEVSTSTLTTTKPLRDAYASCVVGRAKSFAGSPDSTESIVKSAMKACADEKRSLDEALAGVGSAETFLTALDQQVFQAALQAVVEERAAH